jgi:hypothetical protein
MPEVVEPAFSLSVPCEAEGHPEDDLHDTGPAVHYVMVKHACLGTVGEVLPVCGRLGAHVWESQARLIICRECGHVSYGYDFALVVGRVNG